MRRPLAIDLYCGLGGWTEGLLAEGFDVVGFDIEAHRYGAARYPGQLVIQDVRTLHGKQFKDADLIVGSSPCQEFSYRAMPWRRARALGPPVLGIELFEAQFRIQREASEAAGRHVPMVVENVKGAQKWVGRARGRFGSYFLWGDVPALLPIAIKVAKRPGHDCNRYKQTGQVSPHWRMNGEDWHQGPPRELTGEKGGREARRRNWRQDESGEKNAGGSWFRVSHNNVPHSRGDQPPHTPHMTNPDEHAGIKHQASGRAWFDGGPAAFDSKGSKRKAPSAAIAKIPAPLAQFIARTFHP